MQQVNMACYYQWTHIRSNGESYVQRNCGIRDDVWKRKKVDVKHRYVICDNAVQAMLTTYSMHSTKWRSVKTALASVMLYDIWTRVDWVQMRLNVLYGVRGGRVA